MCVQKKSIYRLMYKNHNLFSPVIAANTFIYEFIWSLIFVVEEKGIFKDLVVRWKIKHKYQHQQDRNKR